MPDFDITSLAKEDLVKIVRDQRAQLLNQIRAINPDTLTKISYRSMRQADGFSDSFGDSFSDSFADSFSDSSARNRILEQMRALPPEQLLDVKFSTAGKISGPTG